MDVTCYDIYPGSTIITFLGEHDNVYNLGSGIINNAEFHVPGYPILHTNGVVNTREETLDRVSTERHASVQVINEITTTTTINESLVIKDNEEEDLWTFETIFWICLMCLIAVFFCCFLIHETCSLQTMNDKGAGQEQQKIQNKEKPKEAWPEKQTLNENDTTPQPLFGASHGSTTHFKRKAPREIF